MVMHNFPQFPVDLVSFNEAVLNEKPYFLCSGESELFGFLLVTFKKIYVKFHSGDTRKNVHLCKNLCFFH